MTNKEQLVSWYDKYSQSIFRYVLKMTGDAHKAEDLTQETFIKVFEYLSSGGVLTHPKTYIYQVAHNLTIDYFRKVKPIYLARDFFKRQKGHELPIDSMVIMNEETAQLYAALRKLKDSYRQVIILRKIEEFTIAETAQILKWSESKVKTTLFRAIRKLKKDLTEGGLLNELS